MPEIVPAKATATLDNTGEILSSGSIASLWDRRMQTVMMCGGYKLACVLCPGKGDTDTVTDPGSPLI